MPSRFGMGKSSGGGVFGFGFGFLDYVREEVRSAFHPRITRVVYLARVDHLYF